MSVSRCFASFRVNKPSEAIRWQLKRCLFLFERDLHVSIAAESRLVHSPNHHNQAAFHEFADREMDPSCIVKTGIPSLSFLSVSLFLSNRRWRPPFVPEGSSPRNHSEGPRPFETPPRKRSIEYLQGSKGFLQAVFCGTASTRRSFSCDQ